MNETDNNNVETTLNLEGDDEGIQKPTSIPPQLTQVKVIFNKKKYPVEIALTQTIRELKQTLQPIIDIPPSMMKVMIKGLTKDESTLASLDVTSTTKIMVIGSSLNDVLTITQSSNSAAKNGGVSSNSDDSSNSISTLCKKYKSLLDKGKPENAMPAHRLSAEPLPQTPLTGILNKKGMGVRLSFKLESDEIWIASKERTEKIPMNSIKSVLSEPVENHAEYHTVALQLGKGEASCYWLFWVPAQYVEAIKDSVLGKWDFF